MRRLLLAILLLLAMPAGAPAQERFFRVYEWETPARGWLEPSLWTTYWAKSDAAITQFGRTSEVEKSWAHLFEAEYGVTDNLAASVYGSFDDMPGEPLRYHDTRFEIRYRLFERYARIVESAVYAEYRIPRLGFGEPEQAELKLILQRDFGDFRFLFNPTVTRALSGADSLAPTEAGLASRVAYRRWHSLQPGLELYDEFGSIQQPRIKNEDHVLFATGDLRFGELWFLQIGAGYGLTDAHDVILKSLLQYEFETVRPAEQAR